MDTIFFHQFNTYDTFFFKDHSEIGYEPKVRNKRGFFEKISQSSEEQVFVKNYGNPVALVRHQYIKLIVNKNEKKVSFKIFECSRLRTEGTHYFVVEKNCEFLTVDRITGDVYQGAIKNYNKKTKCRKSFRKNDFSSLNLMSFYNGVRFRTPENIIENQKLFHDAYRVFINEINLNSDEPRNLIHLLLKNYLDKKKVKYPNNFQIFFRNALTIKLKLKDIRKNKNKVVDAFMKLNNLKGEVIKKAFHECEHLNVNLLKECLKLFGYDWVTQDYKLVLSALNSNITQNFYFHLYTNGFLNILGDENHLSCFSNKEKRKIFEFMRDYVIVSENINIFTFFDHIRMFIELRNLGEKDIKWNAVNISSFNYEHTEITTRLEYHKKGFYTRCYPSLTKNKIESPIEIENETYFPILLENTNNYIDESATQSNCVKSYIGNPGSYIVSLRKHDKNSGTRATIEFWIHKEKDDTINFRRRQSLTRFNEKLQDYWEKPIYILEKRFEELIKDKNFVPVKIEKVFQNGKKLSSETYWDEMGILKWSSVDLTNYYD